MRSFFILTTPFFVISIILELISPFYTIDVIYSKSEPYAMVERINNKRDLYFPNLATVLEIEDDKKAYISLFLSKESAETKINRDGYSPVKVSNISYTNSIRYLFGNEYYINALIFIFSKPVNIIWLLYLIFSVYTSNKKSKIESEKSWLQFK